MDIKFSSSFQGVNVLGFAIDSAAESHGVELYDRILEVDGSAVGLIRDRYYELWPRYGRAGRKRTEILVSFVDSDGNRVYYYLPVDLSNVQGPIPQTKEAPLPPDFFTSAKPKIRTKAEPEHKNLARYVLGEGNFEEYSQWELGTEYLSYSYDFGATIHAIKPNTPAATMGLKVGDIILEVNGAPLGVFGDRTYEIWKQYVYSKTGMVELLVAYFDNQQNEWRYYYPEVQLLKRTLPS